MIQISKGRAIRHRASGGFLTLVKAECLFCLFTDFFFIVTSLQKFGMTLHTDMCTKYFHILYYFGYYPPDGYGRGAIIIGSLLALFLFEHIGAQRDDTFFLLKLVSHRSSAGMPGASCSFHGSSCVMRAVTATW